MKTNRHMPNVRKELAPLVNLSANSLDTLSAMAFATLSAMALASPLGSPLAMASVTQSDE